MAYYSTEEKEFLKQLNLNGIRIDGRKFFESRQITSRINIYNTCFSSIDISNGDDSIILTLKGEVVPVDKFDISINFEFTGNCKTHSFEINKDHLEIYSIINEFVIKRLNHNDLFKDINNYSWKLYIDVLISKDSMNISMLDLIVKGVNLLLKEADMPKISVLSNDFDNDNIVEYNIIDTTDKENNKNEDNIYNFNFNKKSKLSNLSEVNQTHRLKINNQIKLIIFGVSDDVLLLDPTYSELIADNSYIILLIDNEYNILELQTVKSNIDLKKIGEIHNYLNFLKENN